MGQKGEDESEYAGHVSVPNSCCACSSDKRTSWEAKEVEVICKDIKYQFGVKEETSYTRNDSVGPVSDDLAKNAFLFLGLMAGESSFPPHLGRGRKRAHATYVVSS